MLANLFEIFTNTCIKTYELDPAHFLSAPRLAWQACSKETKVKLELLTNIDMLLMVKKGTRGGICQAIHGYAKANSKYMKNYSKDVMSSYIEYLDAMSQKLPVNGFKWVKNLSKFNEIFIINYDENNDKGYFLEIDVYYPKKLFDLRKDLPFSPGRKKVNKIEKLICGREDKEKYAVHIKVFKKALSHRLVLKKVHRLIQFNQKNWLKPYIDLNTKLRKEAKSNFEKDFFKLMNNSAFGKT